MIQTNCLKLSAMIVVTLPVGDITIFVCLVCPEVTNQDNSVIEEETHCSELRNFNRGGPRHFEKEGCHPEFLRKGMVLGHF